MVEFSQQAKQKKSINDNPIQLAVFLLKISAKLFFIQSLEAYIQLCVCVLEYRLAAITNKDLWCSS